MVNAMITVTMVYVISVYVMIIVTAMITPVSQCDDHFDTLPMIGVMITFRGHGQCAHMVSVPRVNVMITSNSDEKSI